MAGGGAGLVLVLKSEGAVKGADGFWRAEEFASGDDANAGDNQTLGIHRRTRILGSTKQPHTPRSPASTHMCTFTHTNTQ